MPLLRITTNQTIAPETQIRVLKALSAEVATLLGKSENPIILKGEALDEEEVEKSLGHLKMFATYLYFFRLVSHSYFGDIEYCAKLALEKGEQIQKDFPGSPMNVADALHRVLALIAMARKTRKRQYKTAAKQSIATVKGWLMQGNPNVQHYVSLFDAEWDSLHVGRHHTAKQQYETAIVLAARGGFVQDAALASEKYGSFLLDVLGDADEARYRFCEAAKYYEAWGAHRKARQLRDTHKEMFD